MSTSIQIKRIYDPPAKSDGYRVLVDRLWPRGMKKEAADIDEWAKDLAPSTDLRKWFGHEPRLWSDFEKRYMAELKAFLQAEKQAGKHIFPAGSDWFRRTSLCTTS